MSLSADPESKDSMVSFGLDEWKAIEEVLLIDKKLTAHTSRNELKGRVQAD